MKLITEQINDAKFVIVENKTKATKKLYIEGIFLQGDVVNRNRRMYPLQTLQREVNRYNENYIQKNRALGELGHPDGPTVNLDRVSHKIVHLEQRGTNFWGKAQILKTPMGNIVKSLIEEGVTLGVSSRGVGSLSESRDGSKVVGEDFVLATAADIVADPSATDAFVQGIMEGKEWIYQGGKFHEQRIEQAQKQINKLVDQKALQEHKLQLFDNFIRNL